jgi:hypothetical protein
VNWFPISSRAHSAFTRQPCLIIFCRRAHGFSRAERTMSRVQQCSSLSFSLAASDRNAFFWACTLRRRWTAGWALLRMFSLSLCDSLERDCFVLVHSAGHCWKIDPNLTVDETQAIDFQPRFVFYYLYFHSLSCVPLCCWLTEPDALSSPSDVKEIRRLLCNNTFIVSRNHCTAPWV